MCVNPLFHGRQRLTNPRHNGPTLGSPKQAEWRVWDCPPLPPPLLHHHLKSHWPEREHSCIPLPQMNLVTSPWWHICGLNYWVPHLTLQAYSLGGAWFLAWSTRKSCQGKWLIIATVRRTLSPQLFLPEMIKTLTELLPGVVIRGGIDVLGPVLINIDGIL